MDKMVLLSIVAATVAVPAIGARLADPRRGMRWTLVAMAGCYAAYFLAVMLVVPRLL